MARSRTTFQPGQPATKGTRRGNGAGWGGPAKGAGQPPGNRDAGRQPGVPNGQGKREMARAALEDAAPMAVQTVIEIAGNVSDPRALAAAQAVLNRVGLHEKAGIEHTGADGSPLRYVIEVPPEAESVEAWQAAHRPK